MRRIRKLSVVFLLAVLFWLIASFLDVNAHNMSNQKYSCWNIFSAFIQMRTGSDNEENLQAGTTDVCGKWFG